MKIVNMKCNHIVNLIGYTLNKPRLSWITEAEGGNKLVRLPVGGSL